MPLYGRSIPGPASVPLRYLCAALLVVGGFGTLACVKANPPTDVGNPVAPSSSSSPAPQPAPQPSPQPTGQALSYDQDLKPIFQSDCVFCHGGSRPSAGYSMATYALVMQAVQPGNANSPLVVWTQPGTPMYQFWTGNAAQKAAMVKQWVVQYNAQQSR